MTNRELVVAVGQGVEIDTGDDADLGRRVDILQSCWDDDQTTMIANMLGLMREKERGIALSMAQAQHALNLDGRSAA